MKAKYWRLGLIGWPLTASLSPRLHEAALAAAGLEGEYRLYPIPPLPEGAGALRELTGEVRQGELDGLNVTIPHKLSMIPLLDRLSPEADAIGAVNTISIGDGALCGDNTDAPGFLADLKRLMGDDRVASKGNSTALVLGAGGSARAVTYALAHAGWTVHIAARRPEQAGLLAEKLRMSLAGFRGTTGYITTGTLSKKGLHSFLETASLIVNTTPVGMAPDGSACPWPADLDFPEHAWVYDLIYAPEETTLIQRASAAGLKAANGKGMLVEQAAAAFERWTGARADREAMRRAVQMSSKGEV